MFTGILCSACFCACFWFLLLFIVFKLVNWAIRLPRLGSLNNRYILVTGCDSGFGLLITKRLDALGCPVFAGCLTKQGVDNIVNECSSRAKPFLLDVTKSQSVQDALNFVNKHLPHGKGLWAIMNNAGIGGPACPSEWMKIEDYKLCININLFGLIDMTSTFLNLIKRERGRVVNTASMLGRFALPGCAPNCISKYGVEAYSDILRREMYDFGVGVHIIEPGYFKTNIINQENISKEVTNLFNKADPEVKRQYGQEYLQAALVDNFLTNISSDRLDLVIDAYEHALIGRYPKGRYVVGPDARFLFIPLSFMPHWFADRVLFWMNRRRPRPAIAGKR